MELFLKNLWRWKIGLPDTGLPDLEKTQPPTLQEIYESNWSSKFEKYMRNRLAFGYFRYGPLKDQKMGEYNVIDSIKKRIARYELTGNDEILVDVANLCMVEFIKGIHPNKHFRSEDDGEHVNKNID